ncbi:aldehyde dehydrogenase PutA [Sporothrix schenckii 1099-18]|uniref:Aldehyde dehydrogenase PutA n=1 Tax=Sporothrix schenckii 1099-18 TaxID=1397361 RepID=A0A0F2MBQ4_SPOSC|nr:aldehyde dehydrogenase PutA [Sporothrix schenckii 1099-18]KJR86270.1 aldehyde dehydrogenase PutA [Sporothrix schenckii 1099-18]
MDDDIADTTKANPADTAPADNMSDTDASTSAALRRVRTAAIDGQAHNPVFRKTQLAKLHAALVKDGERLQQAMLADGESAGVRAAEVAVEYSLALQCVADQFAGVDPVQALKDEYAVARGQDAPQSRVPVGVVVVETAESSSHTYMFNVLSAVVPALAAGNCVVVHTPQTLLQTPRLVLQTLAAALDVDIFWASTTATAAPTDAALGHRHVRVLQASASTSTAATIRAPTALPPVVSHTSRVVAIVERDADIAAAATALVRARLSFGGRAPYAPDVVLVSEWAKTDFLAAAAQAAAQFTAEGGTAAGETKTETTKATRAKAAKATNGSQRGDSFLARLQHDAAARIIAQGANGTVASIEDRASAALDAKIGEPLLAVVAVTSVDDAIDLANRLGDRPLSAAFVFTASAPAAKYMGQFVNADLVVVNQFPATLLGMMPPDDPLLFVYSLRTSAHHHHPVGPVAPSGHSLSPPWTGRYTTAHFSLPKPQFIAVPKTRPLVDSILLGGTARQLQELQAKTAAALVPFERPAKAAYVGFFEQGIIVGGLLLLSSVATGTVLCHVLPPNLKRRTRLQYVQHAPPFRVAEVAPRVHGPALHADVAPLHDARLARIEDQLDVALQDHAVVEADGPVHRRRRPGRHVDVAQDGAARDGQARCVLQKVAINSQVGARVVDARIGGVLGAELDGEAPRHIGLREADIGDVRQLVKRRVLGNVLVFEQHRLAGLVVGGNEPLGKAELALVSHDEGGM